MNESGYSLADAQSPYVAHRDEENAFDYTPYASQSRCIPLGINIITRIIVAVLSLLMFIFSILGLVLDVAGFDIQLNYGFVNARIPLERYKIFSYREVYAGSTETGSQSYTGKDKTAVAATAACLIIALIFSVVSLALSITLIALRMVHESQRRNADEARESERAGYLKWLDTKRRRRAELQRGGYSTADLDAETYTRSCSPHTYADEENKRRRVDQNVGVALFAMLLVAVFAFLLALILFATTFFFRYLVITDTQNVSTVYLSGFWLMLAALLLGVVAVVLLVLYVLSGVCVCTSDSCTNRTADVLPDGGHGVSRSAQPPNGMSSLRGSSNPVSLDPAMTELDPVPQAGARPSSGSYPRKEHKRVSGDSDAHSFDPVKKKNGSDMRDATSAQTISNSTVTVAQGLPMALPGPAVPPGYTVEQMQRSLMSGSHPSSSQPPSSDHTGYQLLGLPAPQYQVPQSYQPTTQQRSLPPG